MFSRINRRRQPIDYWYEPRPTSSRRRAVSEQICNCISSSVACILRDRVLFGIALTIVITAYRAAGNAADAFEGGVSVKGGPLDWATDERLFLCFFNLYTLLSIFHVWIEMICQKKSSSCDTVKKKLKKRKHEHHSKMYVLLAKDYHRSRKWLTSVLKYLGLLRSVFSSLFITTTRTETCSAFRIAENGKVSQG